MGKAGKFPSLAPMPTTALPPTPRATLALLGGVAAPWLLWIWHLRGRWSCDVEFYYGWAVPVLAAYLFSVRWSHRPSPGRAPQSFAQGLIVAGSLSLLATLPVLEANPLWTAAGWLAAGAALLVACGQLCLAGGLSWGRHFAFPLVFLFTALPWPAVVREPLVQTLKGLLAGGAAECVSALGHPAVVHGNVIEVAGGFVGVDEACAGLRSLQTVLMAGLFLGELFRLSAARRAGLAVGGLLVALACNFLRSVFLTWTVAQAGAGAGAAWHDRAGEVEMAAALAGVVGLGWWLARKTPSLPPPSGAPAAPRWAGRTILVVCGLLGLGEAATQAWFWSHARRGGAQRAQWSLVAPSVAWREVTLSEQAQRLLSYQAGRGLAWRDEVAGRQWQAYVLRWAADPGLRYALTLHGPAVCLPSAGAKLEADLGRRTVEVAGVALSFRVYRFAAAGEEFYVFFCLWDAQRARPFALGDETGFAAERWRLVREGRRALELAQITLAVNRCRDEAEALTLAADMLPRLLRRD